MTASLYIHIPFCTGKCGYCDFYSIPINKNSDTDLLDRFIDAVLYDIKGQFAIFNIDHVPTVYIGGGTPPVLGAIRIERLLAGLQKMLQPMKMPPVEFTVEANPESADGNFLQSCANGGVNRISMGVQTFHEASRRAARRSGNNRGLLEQRLSLAAGYFPGAVSVDLITGLPFQTSDTVTEDIERVLAVRPAHVSLYSLVIEPGTPLGEQVSQKGEAALSLPCGDEADKLWIQGRDKLEQAGFAQYEVSNFALPQKTCAHNLRYWRMENWLGAGPAASGTIINETAGTARRFTCQADINAYLAAPMGPLGARGYYLEEIDRSSLIRETLLMGFRYREGPDPLIFKRRFGCSIEDCIPKTIARWRERGFFAEGQGGMAVSRNGLLFVNGFLRDAFLENEA